MGLYDRTRMPVLSRVGGGAKAMLGSNVADDEDSSTGGFSVSFMVVE